MSTWVRLLATVFPPAALTEAARLERSTGPNKSSTVRNAARPPAVEALSVRDQPARLTQTSVIRGNQYLSCWLHCSWLTAQVHVLVQLGVVVGGLRLGAH